MTLSWEKLTECPEYAWNYRGIMMLAHWPHFQKMHICTFIGKRNEAQLTSIARVTKAQMKSKKLKSK